MLVDDDIVALASAPGAGAVAVVRVSGNCLIQKLSGFLKPFKQNDSFPKPRFMHYCDFIDDHTVIDDVVAAYYPSHSSYTGDECFEIFCHGSPYVVERIIGALCGAGFRIAEAGEFTRRAFLNGRIDLAKAEGIGALTSAACEHQWRAARHLTSNTLSQHVNELKSSLLSALALLEAQIDFPDEGDTSGVELSQVLPEVMQVRSGIQRLIASFDSGRVARSGLRVVLVGQPNAGKSTLLNKLVGHERAIVTDVAGTTRDYIEESCIINGRLIRLVDTAGLHESEDRIESEGIRRTLEIINHCDLILSLESCETGEDQTSTSQEQILEQLQDTSIPILHIRTKIDLNESQFIPAGSLGISCDSGVGIDLLRSELCSRIDKLMLAIREPDSFFLSTVRQHEACREALRRLDAFDESVYEGAFVECLAFELKSATTALSSVIGQVDNEEVLDVIFSKFCVGK